MKRQKQQQKNSGHYVQTKDVQQQLVGQINYLLSLERNMTRSVEVLSMFFFAVIGKKVDLVWFLQLYTVVFKVGLKFVRYQVASLARANLSLHWNQLSISFLWDLHWLIKVKRFLKNQLALGWFCPHYHWTNKTKTT